MGLFDGMRNKFGRGSAEEPPAWQEEQYYDDEPEAYDVGPGEEGDGSEGGFAAEDGEVTTFNDYDPANFAHVSLETERPLQVASYGEDTGDSYFSSRIATGSGYAASIGTSAARSRGNVRSFSERPSSSRTASAASSAATWDAPADPSFLDKPQPQYSRDIHAEAGRGAAGGDSATRLEVIKPTAYADVERIASAVKGGRAVVLALTGTRPELAKRILDFSFGVAFALDGSVEKEADRVFVISRGSTRLSDADTAYLRDQGILR